MRKPNAALFRNIDQLCKIPHLTKTSKLTVFWSPDDGPPVSQRVRPIVSVRSTGSFVEQWPPLPTSWDPRPSAFQPNPCGRHREGRRTVPDRRKPERPGCPAGPCTIRRRDHRRASPSRKSCREPGRSDFPKPVSRWLRGGPNRFPEVFGFPGRPRSTASPASRADGWSGIRRGRNPGSGCFR